MLENTELAIQITIQRNWQHRVHKTQDKYILGNTEGAILKGQSRETSNIECTSLCASRDALRKEGMRPTTINWRQMRAEHRFFVVAKIATDITTI
jgi:hypothetical protein